MDLLNILEHKEEDAIAYINDAFMLATGHNFQNTHQKLIDMISKERGVINWSKTHSSPLKYSKLALINFTSRHKNANNPMLTLLLKVIKLTNSTKYLGTIVDRHLN
jgi:hypothetical protein